MRSGIKYRVIVADEEAIAWSSLQYVLEKQGLLILIPLLVHGLPGCFEFSGFGKTGRSHAIP